MHVITINAKRGHVYEGMEGKVHRRVKATCDVGKRRKKQNQITVSKMQISLEYKRKST